MMRREDCIAGAAAGMAMLAIVFCEDAAYDTAESVDVKKFGEGTVCARSPWRFC